MYDFRSVFMPYCVERLASGKYVVLNRDYKPLGQVSYTHVNYDDYGVTLKGIGPVFVEKHSAGKNGTVEKFWLYNDGCVPTHSVKNMQIYLKRLEALAKLRVERT
jgi:hypothetical protein